MSIPERSEIFSSGVSSESNASAFRVLWVSKVVGDMVLELVVESRKATKVQRRRTGRGVLRGRAVSLTRSPTHKHRASNWLR